VGYKAKILENVMIKKKYRVMYILKTNF